MKERGNMFILNKLNNKNFYFVYSFLISSILICGIFLINKMNFIDYLFVRSDYMDCIPLIRNFAYDIHQGNNPFFNFTSGLGLNNILAIASDIMSPFNILYLIFYKGDYNVITGIIIVLKIGCIASSFQIFSRKVLNNNSFSSIIFSVFFSLNSYILSYGTITVMWLDAIIVLPLLISSIVDCVKYNKRVLLILLYFYLFVSQFYTAYMVGLYSFIFVILYIFVIYKKQNELSIKKCFYIFSNWILSVLIAVMLASFIWIPTLFFIASNRVPDSTEVVSIETTLLQIINSMYWGMAYGIEGNYAYIYTGIPVLIIFPLYFFNKDINKRDKICSAIVVIFYFLSCISQKLNYVLHAFDQPDSFWYRYSFLISFSLCALACKQIVLLKEDETKKIMLSISIFSFLYLLIQHTSDLWALDNTGINYLNTNHGFIINFLLMVSWGIIFYFMYCKKKLKKLFAIIAIFVLFFELLSYSNRLFPFKRELKGNNEWYNSVEEIVNNIKSKDNGIYRMVISQNGCDYNTDSYFNYLGIGDFGNQEKYSVRHFLSNIGFATSPRVTFENGYNPVSEMILGIKYEINAPIMNRSEENISERDSIIYDDNDINIIDSKYNINDYSLSLGYLISGETILYEYPGRNVFKNVNELVNCFSGLKSDCFVKIPQEQIHYIEDGIEIIDGEDDEYILNRFEDDGSLIIEVNNDNYDECYIQIEVEEPSLYLYDYFISDVDNKSNLTCNGVSTSFSARMVYDEEKNVFKATINSYEDYSPVLCKCTGINIYALNKDNLIESFNELSKCQLEINEFSNGHIKGDITVFGDKRLLFLTIPYDPGWKASVNGIDTEIIRVVDGTFIGIWLPGEGDYEVELDYEVPGLKIGCIVSLCGIMAFLSVVFEKKLKKK